MLSLPVSFLEDDDLFDGRVSRNSGAKRSWVREYRNQDDDFIAEIDTILAAEELSPVHQSLNQSSVTGSGLVTEDRTCQVQATLGSRARQNQKRKVCEFLVDIEDSSGRTAARPNCSTHETQGSSHIQKSSWHKGLAVVGDIIGFVL